MKKYEKIIKDSSLRCGQRHFYDEHQYRPMIVNTKNARDLTYGPTVFTLEEAKNWLTEKKKFYVGKDYDFVIHTISITNRQLY